MHTLTPSQPEIDSFDERYMPKLGRPVPPLRHQSIQEQIEISIQRENAIAAAWLSVTQTGAESVAVVGEIRDSYFAKLQTIAGRHGITAAYDGSRLLFRFAPSAAATGNGKKNTSL